MAKFVAVCKVDDGAERYTFVYTLALPRMDLLAKAIRGPRGEQVTEVVSQQCDEPTGLCFPKEIVEKLAAHLE